MSSHGGMAVDDRIPPEVRRLKQAMAERGHRNADLGRLLGLSSAQVTRIFKGDRRIQMHEWRKIEGWIDGALAASNPDASVAFLPGMVPLYGWAGAADGGFMASADQRLLGSVHMHPAQANAIDPFAVQVIGESMSPRYRPGEIAYLSPNRWPTREQDCLVVTRDGYAYLKEYVGQTDGKLLLRQLNPDEPVEIRLENVEAVHAVVGRG